MQSDWIRAMSRSGTEHALEAPRRVSARMYAEDVATRAIQPGDQNDAVARLNALHGLAYSRLEYEPRRGIAGLFDRILLRRGIRRAFQGTFDALEREFIRP